MTLALSSVRPRGRRRWLVWGLFASLVINAFLIGWAVTEIFGHKRISGPLRFEMRWLEGKLPADDLARVQAAVAAVGPSVQVHIDRMKEMRRELGALAAAPEPDRAAVDAKLAAIRDELGAMTREGQAAVADALLALPESARVKLAEGGSE